MNITLENEHLRVEIDTFGGELQSLKRNGFELEYLWQGCTDAYSKKAINIFPYVARLTEGKYIFDDRCYEMPQHGFVSMMDMEIESYEKSKVVLELQSNEHTKCMYPWDFTYKIIYELINNAVNITFSVENRSKNDMYFGLGGHPGFNVPLEKNLPFESYYLEFLEKRHPIKVGMSNDCFVNGEDEEFILKNDRTLNLSHELFDNDAIILKDMSREVSLKSDLGELGVTVKYPDMDYLGIWHRPKTESQYVCIEPWSSLPSRENTIEDFKEQKNLCRLEMNGRYENKWEILLW